MRRILSFVAAALAALALAVVPAGADPSPAGGANNVAIATTLAGATLSEHAALQVALDVAPTAASANLALASATDCSGCRSVAVALQAVIVAGSPTVFAPTNVAAAFNTSCDGCTSYAYAYQDVVQTSGPVHLTPAGQAAIADLRARAGAVADSGLTPAEMTTQLDALAAQLDDVIRAQLAASGVTGTIVPTREVHALGQ